MCSTERSRTPIGSLTIYPTRILSLLTILISCGAWGLLIGALPAQVDFTTPDQTLSRLDPSHLEAYRNLAEEISLIKGSPAARDLTIRLYLICASQAEGKLRRSALRGLVQSARSQKEQQAFKVLSFLSDPEFRNVLRHSKPSSSAPSDQTAGENQENETPKEKLLDALVSIRNGKPLRAKNIMQDSDVQQLFKRFEKRLSLKEFNEACLMGELSNKILFDVLSIDAELRDGGGDAPAKTKDAADAWRELFRGKLPERVPEITFETVTEFDPSKSIYRNGVWRKPPK